MSYILFIFFVAVGGMIRSMTSAEFANSTMCDQAALEVKQAVKWTTTLCVAKGK